MVGSFGGVPFSGPCLGILQIDLALNKTMTERPLPSCNRRKSISFVKGLSEMRSGIKVGISTLLAIALIPMIGCGGGSKPTPPPPAATTYTIGGTVTGLTGTGLVLQDDGGNNVTVSASATSFTFNAPVLSNGAYSVTVLTQPAGESCTVTNGNGMATANVTNVSVACTPQYTIGGTITGFIGTGLVLEDNGGDDLTVSANATSFTFPAPVFSGGAYKVTVLTQPAGENCTVANDSGTATANVTNANVTCTQLYTISGTVTGLAGTGLVLQDNGGDNLTVSANATNFTFATSVVGGGAYSITVLTQPTGEGCTVTNGSGTATANVNNVSVVCVGEWTWMGGSSAVGLNDGQAGVYGTLGTPGPTTVPGGREQSTTWSDASGNVWLFGGYGHDSAGTGGQLNDLWKFDPTLGTGGEWTWMSGSTISPPGLGYGIPNGEPGVYGTLETASPTNVPGGREQTTSWKDASGKLWLFGGIGIDSVGEYGFLSDLWKFDPTLGANGEWTWMGGSSTAPNYGGQPGVYGTLGTAASTNIPGGRYGAVTWTDASGNFWLFGGNGYDSTGTNGYLNDLWKYMPGTNGNAGNWTWMGGSNTIGSNGGQPGVYGILGTTAATNVPGARFSPVSWVDASGNLWLFGGQGYDWTGAEGYLNDLWKYTPNVAGDTGEWTWMGGSNTVPPSPTFGTQTGQPGIYGTLGTAAPTNSPGGRFGAGGWVDASGNLWLFGGQGNDSTGAQGYLNDVWRYQP